MFKFCRTMKRKSSYRGGKQQIKATVVQQFRYNDPSLNHYPEHGKTIMILSMYKGGSEGAIFSLPY